MLCKYYNTKRYKLAKIGNKKMGEEETEKKKNEKNDNQ